MDCGRRRGVFVNFEASAIFAVVKHETSPEGDTISRLIGQSMKTYKNEIHTWDKVVRQLTSAGRVSNEA
jgi:hypothetical protein